MNRRKGELAPAGIDRGWPHQVALRDETDHAARFERHKAIEAFCAAQGIDRAPRGHAFIENDRWHNVHCFATREQAELFKAEFGGEWFDPRERGRGSNWTIRRKKQ